VSDDTQQAFPPLEARLAEAVVQERVLGLADGLAPDESQLMVEADLQLAKNFLEFEAAKAQAKEALSHEAGLLEQLG